MSMETNEGEVSSVKLKDMLTSLAGAFVSAKSSMDKLSAEKSKEYQKEELLSTISLPFFSISDVKLDLKFAIRKVGRDNEILVSVDAQSLEKLPPHIISMAEIKLSPQPLKIYKMEDGKRIPVPDTPQ